MNENQLNEIAKELLAYCNIYHRLIEVKKLKNEKAKAHRYEAAAILRDEEKALIEMLPSEEVISEISKLILK